MKRFKNQTALLRAIGAISGVVIMVSGVTFAVLQSQQIKLTGNTIQTATADLQISPDGINYTSTQSGFTFSNIVPGGQPMPLLGNSFYLKNSGATPLALKFAVSSTPSNPNLVDLSKISIILTPSAGGSAQSFTLAALIAANTTGGLSVSSPAQLMPNASATYTLQVSMASDALTGSGATLGNIDFAFTGIAQSN